MPTIPNMPSITDGAGIGSLNTENTAPQTAPVRSGSKYLMSSPPKDKQSNHQFPRYNSLVDRIWLSLVYNVMRTF